MDSLQQLYEKLSSLTSENTEILQQKVMNKVTELSGLVSEEGAIYIVANEMGVKLDTSLSSSVQSTNAEVKKIDQILEAKVSINLQAKVLRVYDLVEFTSKTGNSGKVQSLLVGDETGIIRIVFWGDKTDLIKENSIERDTILEINNGYVRENTNTSRMEVHFGEYSDMTLNPEGLEITVKEMKPEGVEKQISDLEVDDRNVLVNATIVDVDIPRFYLGCPHTFKKVFVEDGKYISPDHGEVDPVKVPITNIIVNDSSGTLGIVAFRNRAEDLFSKTAEEIVNLAEDLDGYRDLSKQLVGSKVQVIGNISENQMSGELQLIVNEVVLVDADLSKKENTSNSSTPQKEESSDNSVQEESKDDLIDLDDDLDIEEIDIDDDLL